MIQSYKEILADLISFNTISSLEANKDHGNTNLISYVKDFFDALGFYTSVYKVFDGKYNLLASTHKDTDGGLLLTCHTDTVGFNIEKWKNDPFILDHADDRLIGRGVTDTKGFLAVVMDFCANFKKTKLPLKVLLTADQETTMSGVVNYVQNVPLKHDLCIVAEPTMLYPVVAAKGYMGLYVDILGKTIHSSNPEKGSNAINGIVPFVKAIEDLEENYKSNFSDHRFSVPYPTINLGKIIGGHSVNTVCDNVRILFDARPIKSKSETEIYNDLTKIAKSLSNTKLQYKIGRLHNDIDLFDCNDKDTIDFIMKVANKESYCINYCTEAGFLSANGPCIVLGPGSIKDAHKDNESIEVKQLDDFLYLLSLIYSQLSLKMKLF